MFIDSNPKFLVKVGFERFMFGFPWYCFGFPDPAAAETAVQLPLSTRHLELFREVEQEQHANVRKHLKNRDNYDGSQFVSQTQYPVPAIIQKSLITGPCARKEENFTA